MRNNEVIFTQLNYKEIKYVFVNTTYFKEKYEL
jgi:hypothetical protein